MRWSWKSPITGNVTISTAGSSFDTVLGVFAGSVLGKLKQVAGNDDARGGVQISTVKFRAKAGVTYSIAVAGYGQAAGSIHLAIRET